MTWPELKIFGLVWTRPYFAVDTRLVIEGVCKERGDKLTKQGE
jgi:hypothetical protein